MQGNYIVYESHKKNHSANRPNVKQTKTNRALAPGLSQTDVYVNQQTFLVLV